MTSLLESQTLHDHPMTLFPKYSKSLSNGSTNSGIVSESMSYRKPSFQEETVLGIASEQLTKNSNLQKNVAKESNPFRDRQIEDKTSRIKEQVPPQITVEYLAQLIFQQKIEFEQKLKIEEQQRQREKEEHDAIIQRLLSENERKELLIENLKKKVNQTELDLTSFASLERDAMERLTNLERNAIEELEHAKEELKRLRSKLKQYES